MVIRGLGNVAIPAASGRAGGSSGAFSVGAGPATAGSARVAAPVAPTGLLLLQEVTDAPARDRRARQHGRALLDALARLQIGLLADEHGDSCGPQILRDLAGLAEGCPEASDPALKSALDAIRLRAQVEVARRGM